MGLRNRIFGFVLIGAVFPITVPAQNADETGDYFEGDIQFMPPPLSAFSRAGVINTRYRWSQKTIPYDFESDYPQALKKTFQEAISHISSKTCIKFVPRTKEPDYIRVIAGQGCYSSVGKIGGRQTVSLPENCNLMGIFAHELIHALGFHHEQSRTDRDDYVKIKLENVKPGTEQNFQKFSTSIVAPFGVTYDYGSIMHYSKLAFSKNGRGHTIEPIKPNVEIGQRRAMSKSDIDKINNMYCK